MKYGLLAVAVGILVTSGSVSANDLTVDAAIGGAVGGALGGAVGAELGGREGAIIGAGIGGAAGTAINTRDHADNKSQYSEGRKHHSHSYHAPSQGRFCPPGQAKKGRC